MSFWQKIKKILRGLLRIDDCCNKVESQKKTLIKLQKTVEDNQRKLNAERRALEHYLNQEFASIRKEIASAQKEVTGIQKEVTGIQKEVSGVQMEVSGIQKAISGVQKAVNDVKNSQNAKTNAFLKSCMLLVEPEKLLSNQFSGEDFDGFDIIIKYMAIEDIVRGIKGDGLDLYMKMYAARELDSIYNIERFRDLIQSFKGNEGFALEKPIEVSSSGIVMDGSHRLACALYFKCPLVSILVRREKKVARNFSLDFFRKHKFSRDEIMRIVERQREIFFLGGCFTSILFWTGAEENIIEFEKLIERNRKFKIVSGSKIYLTKDELLESGNFLLQSGYVGKSGIDGILDVFQSSSDEKMPFYIYWYEVSNFNLTFNSSTRALENRHILNLQRSMQINITEDEALRKGIRWWYVIHTDRKINQQLLSFSKQHETCEIDKIGSKTIKEDLEIETAFEIQGVYKEDVSFQCKVNPYNPEIRKGLQLVDPKKILSAGRLDIIVYYYLFRDLCYGNISDINKSLYCHTILSRTGAVEPVDTWSSMEKEDIEVYLDEAKKLFESMKQDGFQLEGYVSVANDQSLFNGAHRIACAIALDQDIWVRYSGETGVKDLDFSYYDREGFSTEDKIRILRGFADIHKDCAIFIMYGSVIEKWEYMIKEIAKDHTVVGYVDLDFANDYVGFKNLIFDIYNVYKENSVISRKVDLLLFAELKLRIVLVSDEALSDDKDFYHEVVQTKTRLRNELEYEYSKDAFVTVHASDDYGEFNILKQVVLSVNNIRCIHMRSHSDVRKEFSEWISEYKEWMLKNNFNTDDACIVGSSPLEVMGIRDSTDIDIVISPEMREIYGEGVTHLTPNLDIATRNYVRRGNRAYITDEQLIYDDNCHFMFMGVKFANPEYILYRKSNSKREKDIKDVKLLKIFFEYSKFFDNKKILQEQIQKELIRRNLIAKPKLPDKLQ